MQLSNIYRDQQSHFDLFLLCEALVEYDEMFTLWRLRHVQMVERVIGWKPGTGGSSGAAYLRTTVERRFFPDLWDLRTHLGAPAL
jgi:tryptophan 2,3-dioxygenase